MIGASSVEPLIASVFGLHRQRHRFSPCSQWPVPPGAPEHHSAAERFHSFAVCSLCPWWC